MELNVPFPREESDDETIDITKVKISDFLVVKLKAGVKTRKFVAQVTELTESIVVSFLQSLPETTNKFVFPAEVDVARVELEEIGQIIPNGDVIPDRRRSILHVKGISLQCLTCQPVRVTNCFCAFECY